MCPREKLPSPFGEGLGVRPTLTTHFSGVLYTNSCVGICICSSTGKAILGPRILTSYDAIPALFLFVSLGESYKPCPYRGIDGQQVIRRMPKSIENVRVPLQTWSKASEDTSNYCWGLTNHAHTRELQVSRIYKIK